MGSTEQWKSSLAVRWNRGVPVSEWRRAGSTYGPACRVKPQGSRQWLGTDRQVARGSGYGRTHELSAETKGFLLKAGNRLEKQSGEISHAVG